MPASPPLRFSFMKRLLVSLFPILPVSAGMTYVDATPANTTLADGTAMVAAATPTQPFEYSTGTTQETNDQHWRYRSGFANGSTVWASAAGSNSPGLRTRLSGLEAGEAYDIRLYYWIAGDGAPTGSAEWDIAAGGSASALTQYPWNAGTFVNAADFTAPAPLLSEGNRRLLVIDLGELTAQPGGTIDVFVDDFPGNDDRTWYDGLGYQLAGEDPPPDPALIVQVAPDGAWTWFNDERAIFHQGFLYAGYVKADGNYGLTRFDPATSTASHMTLSTATSLQKDDHNNPSLTVLPDGRILAVYSKHGTQAQYYYRRSNVETPATDADWGAEQIKTTPANTTYANTFRLQDEGNKIFNFHRCINFNPTLTFSTDNAASWGSSQQLIDAGTGSVRPYPRYCSNHRNRIDMIYTDGHPRDLNNSVYHLYYQDSAFRKTDGSVVSSLANLPMDHDGGERGSVVYQYSADAWGAGDGPDNWIPTGRGWTWDVCYGKNGAPVCVFQVQRDNVTGSGWNHDRIYYYYARWTGTAWQRRFIAQAGRGLYSSEDDYGGGMTIDPEDPRVVYISSNAADPFNLADIDNVPLRAGDRYEIYRGFTADGGLSFTWTPVTKDSTQDNLRPIVPEGHGRTRHLLWFRGTYSSYTSYNARVVGIFDPPKKALEVWAADSSIPVPASDEDSDGDGVPDLIEYASGGNPMDPLDAPRPALEAGEFSFDFPADRTDVECLVEGSGDLLAWTALATIRAADLPSTLQAPLTLARDGQRITLSPLPPAGTTPNSFVRLRVRRN